VINTSVLPVNSASTDWMAMASAFCALGFDAPERELLC
jgi:hypothetical protein